MYYIVGLGNPGERYEHTRHNVGQIAVDRLREHIGCGDWAKSNGANARYVRGMLEGEPVELVLPDTYINRSGETFRYLMEKHNATVDAFIVVYDDVDLPLGTFKLAAHGGAGSHNGVKSVIAHTNDPGFIRVRIGIAPRSFWTGTVKRPAGGGALERYVLGRMSRSDVRTLDSILPDIHAAIACVVRHGVARAMNEYN